jgi:hypothetical protein
LFRKPEKLRDSSVYKWIGGITGLSTALPLLGIAARMKAGQNDDLLLLYNVEDTVGEPAQQPTPDIFVEYSRA